MLLSQLKSCLESLDQIVFRLENGDQIPSHFHVTEVGKIHRHFIDCGGKEREETVINFQLWTTTDYDHRLSIKKLKQIINLSIEQLKLPDALIEVEYQGATIGKYGLDFKNNEFILTKTTTACLAPNACGAPVQKPKIRISKKNGNSCVPGNGCC